jgi:lipopolysaccharide/colanic/teichoic acid biosynthesis glycosyltransferase
MFSEYNLWCLFYPGFQNDLELFVAPDVSEHHADAPSLRLQRCLDFSLAAIALLITLPLLAVTALALKFVSPQQPLLLRECRIGKDGRMFHLYKFHCAAINVDKLHRLIDEIVGRQPQTSESAPDPLALQLAYIIRSTGLDNLPMLFNVLKGDISLLHAPADVPWLFHQPLAPSLTANRQTVRQRWQADNLFSAR